MERKLWGECEEDNDNDEEISEFYNDKLPPIINETKQMKLEDETNSNDDIIYDEITVVANNSLITQTVEVMKQTEMLQTLIDTYSNKSGTSNYLLNPCEMIPEVHFPPENAANFRKNLYIYPLWYLPAPTKYDVPQVSSKKIQLDGNLCRAWLRKAISGHLRVSGFTDASELALILFTDAIEEFLQGFIDELHTIQVAASIGRERHINIGCLERAYTSYTSQSMTSIYNYFKHHVMQRNRAEIAEFEGVSQEYDKLMLESQSMQRDDFNDTDIFNILEMAHSNDHQHNHHNHHNHHEMNGHSNTYISLLDGSTTTTSATTTATGTYKENGIHQVHDQISTSYIDRV